MPPNHAKKGNKRYCYYASRSLVTGAASSTDGLRLPAGEVEALVIGALLQLIRTPTTLLEAIGPERLGGVEQKQLLLAAARLGGAWDQLGAGRVRYIVRSAVTRVAVHLDRVVVSVAIGHLADIVLGRDDPSERGRRRGTERSACDLHTSIAEAGRTGDAARR